MPPLLTTLWDQGWPYNEMCPTDAAGPGGHVWAGCVATAMSQILKYHNYPSQGLGSYGYQWGSYPYTGANFGTTTYNWANMPNSISTSNTDISNIMYQTAVSCRSMWGPGSTGVGYSSDSDPMTRALVNYFKAAYSTIQYVESQYYTTTQWNSLIQGELTNNRPVYYRGDGVGSHAWVCDGVDASNMYHFNWGWGGSYNGYFALTAITPGGFNFTSNQHAIVGIKPNDGSTLITNTTWSGNVTKSTNVAVPDAISLTVNAGATINFAENCKLQIWGKLTSTGTTNSYVKFTAVDTTDGWLGIKWDNTHMNGEVMSDNDSSKLIYTQVEYSDQHGIFCQAYGKVVIDHCKINNNDAGSYNSSTGQTNGYGGGVSVWNQPINITNTEIYNNHAEIKGAAGYVGFIYTLSSIISKNDIHGNVSNIDGGGFYFNDVNNILFTENIIHNNQAINGAGGALMFGSPTITGNKFCNNATIGSGGKGGGLYIASCSANIVDNLFANNTRSAIYITTNSNPTLLNNTISNNSEPDYGGGVRIMYGSNPVFKNTILYGNTAPNGSQISLETTDCDPIFNHCDVQNGIAGFGGPGAGSNYTVGNYANNIELNPIYISPSGGSGTGYDGLNANWQLQSTSPCINAGDSTGVGDLLPALDLGGNPRFNGVIDIGAYEACNVPAQPSTITGSSTPCQNSTQIYSVTNVSGVTYTWTVPTGSTISNGQGSNSITVTIGATSGNISVTPSNACGNGTSRTLAVTINYVTANAGNDQSIPYGTSTILNGSASNGSGSYTYHWEPANMLVNPNIQNPTTVNLTSSIQFTLTVTDAVSGCTGNDQVWITISGGPLDVTAVASPDEICESNSSQLDAIASGGSGSYTYAWTSNPVGFTSNIHNPVVYPTITTTYTVVVNDGVNTVSDWVIVTVNPLPSTPTIPVGPDTVDLYHVTTSEYSTSTVANADDYIWVLEPSSMGTISGNGIDIIVTWSGALGQASLSVRAVNACGESSLSQPLSIHVDNTVGVDDIENSKINIYPNPSNGVFFIKSSEPLSSEPLSEVILLDQMGKLISRSQKPDENTKFDYSQLCPGVYFVHIIGFKMNVVKKIIITR
ncbi:MAG: C10 family peptidase [Candidatus Absconditicoccaceae bacterium]